MSTQSDHIWMVRCLNCPYRDHARNAADAHRNAGKHIDWNDKHEVVITEGRVVRKAE